MAADVINCGDEGQGGQFGAKEVRTRGLPFAAIFVFEVIGFNISLGVDGYKLHYLLRSGDTFSAENDDCAV